MQVNDTVLLKGRVVKTQDNTDYQANPHTASLVVFENDEDKTHRFIEYWFNDVFLQKTLNPEEEKKLLLEGKCTKCGRQKYGFFRGAEDRIKDLFYKRFAYQDTSDPTGSTWVFREGLNPDEVLEQILEAL